MLKCVPGVFVVVVFRVDFLVDVRPAVDFVVVCMSVVDIRDVGRTVVDLVDDVVPCGVVVLVSVVEGVLDAMNLITRALKNNLVWNVVLFFIL